MNLNKNKIRNLDFSLLQKYITEKTGIVLSDHRRDKILAAIEKRIERRDSSSLCEYLNLLESSSREKQFVVNLVTNVTTKFFREQSHFVFLKKIIPDLCHRDEKIRVWSAGCASGEEPYSIAIMFFENIKNIRNFDIKILATDINTDALEIARAGIYKQNEVEALEGHKRWFSVLKSNQAVEYRIDPQIKSIIRFKEFNFLDPWPVSKKFDIIFFRNVSIYMTQNVTENILKKFGDFLYSGGFLFLGATETLGSIVQQYKSFGNNIYLKLPERQTNRSQDEKD